MSITTDPAADATATAPPKGHPLIAWGVIVLVVTTVCAGQLLLSRKMEARKKTTNLVLLRESREFVALAQMDSRQKDKAYEQAEPLKTGSDRQRLCYIVLAGELKGPKEALKQLQELGQPTEDADVAVLLDKLYRDYEAEKPAAPSLSDEDRQELHDKLGWFGDLALNPEATPDTAARTAILAPARQRLFVTIGFGIGVLALGFIGFNLLLVLAILLLLQIIRFHFTTGSPNGGIYAETFAVWLVLFVVLSIAGAFVDLGQFRMLAAGAASLGSLAALAWPVFRGIPWKTVRAEIGLVWKDPLPTQIKTNDPSKTYPRAWEDDYTTPPRNLSACLEPLYGFGAYLATLPLLFIGALITLGLMQLYKTVFGESADPSHPIAADLIEGNWWGRIQIIVLASVLAPILEETMFRGVLYRHLREVTGKAGRFWSILASAGVVSFVFAVIHPQGFLAVPALMALAIGFSLAREWRGTLIPAMVAHGLNNTLVTVVLLVTIS